MGLVFDLVRQQHNETKTQDITCFQSHKMTLLSIHFCRLLCFGGGGGTQYSMLEKIFFKGKSIFIEGEKRIFLAYCYDLQKI